MENEVLIAELRDEIDVLNSKINTERKNILDLDEEIEKLNKKIKKLNTSVKEYETMVETIEQTNSILKEQVNKIAVLREVISRVYTSADAELEYNSIQTYGSCVESEYILLNSIREEALTKIKNKKSSIRSKENLVNSDKKQKTIKQQDIRRYQVNISYKESQIQALSV